MNFVLYHLVSVWMLSQIMTFVKNTFFIWFLKEVGKIRKMLIAWFLLSHWYLSIQKVASVLWLLQIWIFQNNFIKGIDKNIIGCCLHKHKKIKFLLDSLQSFFTHNLSLQHSEYPDGKSRNAKILLTAGPTLGCDPAPSSILPGASSPPGPGPFV